MVTSAETKAMRKEKTAARRAMKEARKQQLVSKKKIAERTGTTYKIRSCKLCGISTTSARDWEIHVVGKRHMASLDTACEVNKKKRRDEPQNPDEEDSAAKS